MWFGFGQTVARNYAKFPSALNHSSLLAEWKDTTDALLKPLRTDECSEDWWKEVTLGVNETCKFTEESGTCKFSRFDKVAWEKFNGTFEAPADDIT